jgi:hypothetical protein
VKNVPRNISDAVREEWTQALSKAAPSTLKDDVLKAVADLP